MKVDSFDIPRVKHELVPTNDIQNVKFPSELLLEAPITSPYPNYHENSILVAPIEFPASDPYKLPESADPVEQGPLFDKYSVSGGDFDWSSGNYGAMPSMSYIPPNKEKLAGSEEDFITELLDLGGLIDPNIPTDNWTGMPTTEIPTPQQAMGDYNPVFNDVSPTHFTNDLPYLPQQQDTNNSLVPEDTKTTELTDVCIPTTVGGEPTLCNNIAGDSDVLAGVDLQELFSEFFGSDNIEVSNALGSNVPSEPLFIPTTPPSVEETNQNKDVFYPVLEDVSKFKEHIPPAKRHCSSESSSVFPMESSPGLWHPPLDPLEPTFCPSPHSPTENSASIPHSPSSIHSPVEEKPSKNKSVMLFGQHEDEIIHKLLVPKPGLSSRPVTRDKLVTMPVEDFNALLDQAELTEIEVAFMKEWRRRGKNKMAAQIARKRKRDELSELQDEIDQLQQQRSQLEQSAKSLMALIASVKGRAKAAENRIYKKHSTARGTIVSRETHNIHVTEDSKTILVPRISSQILIV